MIRRAALLTSVFLIATTLAAAQEETQRQPLQPGAEAPGFTATTLEGVPLSIEQWEGRVVVLNYFITWYRDAAQHLDMMEQLQTQYSREGMRLVSISLDEGDRGEEQVRELVRDAALAHPVVIDADQEIAEQYGVRALPAIFVIGRDGAIAYYHEGYTEGDEGRLARAIAQTLGVEPPAENGVKAIEEVAEDAEQPVEPVCNCFRRNDE